MTFAGDGHVGPGLFSVPKTGGDVSQVMADSAMPGTVAIDSTNVYWADADAAHSLGPK